MNAYYDLVQKLSGGEMAAWAAVLIIIAMSLVQVAPVRLNPWDKILNWFGRTINGKLQEQMDALQKQVSDLWINSHRQSILTFARECRADIDHDAEEWNHILSVADEYETYCEKNTVSNGVVKADTRYVRELYQELSRQHRI